PTTRGPSGCTRTNSPLWKGKWGTHRLSSWCSPRSSCPSRRLACCWAKGGPPDDGREDFRTERHFRLEEGCRSETGAKVGGPRLDLPFALPNRRHGAPPV